MKRLFRKLFPKKPVYEPAGIVRPGYFQVMLGITLYEAYGQDDGNYRIYAITGDKTQRVGIHPKDEALYAIIDHAKGSHDR